MANVAAWKSSAVPVLVLVSLLPGCLDQAETGGEGPRFLSPLGMGMEITSSLPPPGPFLEDRHDLSVLEGFLREEGAEILHGCGNPEAIRTVRGLLHDGRHGDAAWELIWACEIRGEPLEVQVREAMADGSERELFEDWHEMTLVGLGAVEEWFNDHRIPGNVVEAELMQSLMRLHQWDRDVIKAAFMDWNAYERDGKEGALYHALLNLRWRDAQTMLDFLQQYPWSNGTCEAPDVPELLIRIHSKLDVASRLAEERGDSETIRYVYAKYGRLDQIINALPYYEDNGWWPMLMAMEVDVETQIAYWENLTAPAWVTFEEAEAWLAMYRNETRTIWTEKRLDSYIYFFESDLAQGDVDWHHDIEAGAASFMGEMAIRWPYRDLQCT